MPYRTKPLPELSADHIARFHASYVKDASGCWFWTGRVQSSGYGAMYVRRSIYRAHRLSFAIHAGRDPGDLIVCHRCDNPRCVNPDHLWLGTDQDNTDDREAKGRSARPGTPAQCIKCGHDRTDDYVERRPGGREVRRCRNCVKLRDAGAPAPWHQAPKAQAILARIDPADVMVLESRDAIRADGYYLAVDDLTEKALNALRHGAVDAALGYTFASVQDPFDAAASMRWLDKLDAVGPSIPEVLAERFGSPDIFRGYSRDQAEQRWRIAATARCDRELAA